MPSFMRACLCCGADGLLLSKHHLQPHLHLPAGTRRTADHTEAGIAESHSRLPELRRIKDVERLRTELDPHRFPPRYTKQTLKRKIGRHCSRTGQDIPPGVALDVLCGKSKCRCVEPAAH